MKGRSSFVLNTDLYQSLFYESETIIFRFTIILITVTCSYYLKICLKRFFLKLFLETRYRHIKRYIEPNRMSISI